MSKFDTKNWQIRILEALFKVVKEHGPLSASDLNDLTIDELNVCEHDRRIRHGKTTALRYRINWERKALEQVGYLSRTDGPGPKLWCLGPGGEVFSVISGQEVLQTLSAMNNA